MVGLTGGTGIPRAFATDDGSVPDEVSQVLAAYTAGRARLREVVTCVAAHRLLIPLLEVDADQLEGDDADPCAGQDRAMAAVSVRQPDGTTMGLAFTGTTPMAGWDASARPLPVSALRAAGAVLAGGGTALLIDARSPHACRISGLALARLATGEAWPEPWEDPEVRRAVLVALAPAMAGRQLGVRLSAPGALGAGVNPARANVTGEADPIGDVDPTATAAPAADADLARPDLVVQLRFAAGVPAGLVAGRAARVAEVLGESPLVRAVFDGTLAVTVVEQLAR